MTIIRKPLVLIGNDIKELPVDDSLDISASSLRIIRIATEGIVSGELVKSDSPTNVSLANNDLLSRDAVVLGVAVNSALAGEQVVILLMGVLSNTAYSIVTLNTLLFLDVAGGITDVRPVAPAAKYLTSVGKSLGGNSIFIQISDPRKLS
jgi:hypothetical protein